MYCGKTDVCAHLLRSVPRFEFLPYNLGWSPNNNVDAASVDAPRASKFLVWVTTGWNMALPTGQPSRYTASSYTTLFMLTPYKPLVTLNPSVASGKRPRGPKLSALLPVLSQILWQEGVDPSPVTALCIAMGRFPIQIGKQHQV